MSKVFFIADTHFGHRNICKYRPFKDPKEHDELIIENWNKVVTKRKCIVWVLGDMCIENKYYNMNDTINRLNGTINVITGNHCHLPYYNAINGISNGKINVRNGISKKYKCWLSHCPIHPNELRGSKNIHGHVHNKTIDDKRYINVCAENINYTPISLDEIREKYGV